MLSGDIFTISLDIQNNKDSVYHAITQIISEEFSTIHLFTENGSTVTYPLLHNQSIFLYINPPRYHMSINIMTSNIVNINNTSHVYNRYGLIIYKNDIHWKDIEFYTELSTEQQLLFYRDNHFPIYYPAHWQEDIMVDIPLDYSSCSLENLLDELEYSIDIFKDMILEEWEEYLRIERGEYTEDEIAQLLSDSDN